MNPDICKYCRQERNRPIHADDMHPVYHNFTPLFSNENKGDASKTTANTRSQVLDEAYNLINGDRQDDYGTPQESFGTLAALWSEYLGVSLRPSQVAMCLALLKVARQKHGPKKQDTYVDAAGYCALAAELAMEEE